LFIVNWWYANLDPEYTETEEVEEEGVKVRGEFVDKKGLS
jgi:hypothetical protein